MARRPPPGIFRSVTAGTSHTCGLRADGSAACWGRDTYGQATAPSGTFAQLSAGGNHTCGLATDGHIECWGWDGYGQATAPAGAFVSLGAGTDHTCAVTQFGALSCWGDAVLGQLGLAPAITSPAPGPVGFGTVFSHVFAVTGAPTPELSLTGTLPAGLAFDPATGTLSGTATELGSFGPLLSADNGFAPAATQTITLQVVDVTGPETIIVSGPSGTVIGQLILELDGTDDVSAAEDLTYECSFDAGTIWYPCSSGSHDPWPGSFTAWVRAVDEAGNVDNTPAVLEWTVDRPGSEVSGVVTGPGGEPAVGVTVWAYLPTDRWMGSGRAVTASDGSYTIKGLPAGDYSIRFVPTAASGLVVEWHIDALARADATAVTVDGVGDVGGLDAQLDARPGITGVVTDADGAGVADVAVVAYFPTDGWFGTAWTITEADGSYMLHGIAPGDYRIRFGPPTSALRAEWYDDATSRGAADEVSVIAGTMQIGVDAILDPQL